MENRHREQERDPRRRRSRGVGGFENEGERERDERFERDRMAGEGGFDRSSAYYRQRPDYDRSAYESELGRFGDARRFERPSPYPYPSDDPFGGRRDAFPESPEWRDGPGWGSPGNGGARRMRERGEFTGRGPKGYRRSDERVLEDVNQALEDHPEIDASEIEVSCQNGEIVLRGTVCDRRMKRLAEDCIEELPGVKEVRNELRLSGGQG